MPRIIKINIKINFKDKRKEISASCIHHVLRPLQNHMKRVVEIPLDEAPPRQKVDEEMTPTKNATDVPFDEAPPITSIDEGLPLTPTDEAPASIEQSSFACTSYKLEQVNLTGDGMGLRRKPAACLNI